MGYGYPPPGVDWQTKWNYYLLFVLRTRAVINGGNMGVYMHHIMPQNFWFYFSLIVLFSIVYHVDTLPLFSPKNNWNSWKSVSQRFAACLFDKSDLVPDTMHKNDRWWEKSVILCLFIKFFGDLILNQFMFTNSIPSFLKTSIWKWSWKGSNLHRRIQVIMIGTWHKNYRLQKELDCPKEFQCVRTFIIYREYWWAHGHQWCESAETDRCLRSMWPEADLYGVYSDLMTSRVDGSDITSAAVNANAVAARIAFSGK